MKTKTFLLIFCTFNYFFCTSQTLNPKVFSTCGGYFSGGGNSLSWTLGETFNASFTAGNKILTQGFQQPYLELTILNMRAFLEGYYEGAFTNSQPSGQMNDNGGLGGLLHKVSPGSHGYSDVDTITISVMNVSSPHALVESKKGIINISGNVSVQFSSAVVAGQSYYIKVNHRNSIETWSANPVLFTKTTTYDFTTAANKAYANNMVQTSDGLYYAFFSGDISDATTATVGLQDGIVESQDYGDMENAVYFTLLGYVTEDITGDAVVESADYGLVETNKYYTRVSLHP